MSLDLWVLEAPFFPLNGPFKEIIGERVFALPSPDHRYISVNWAMMERVINGHAAIGFLLLSGQFGRNRPNLIGRELTQYFPGIFQVAGKLAE